MSPVAEVTPEPSEQDEVNPSKQPPTPPPTAPPIPGAPDQAVVVVESPETPPALTPLSSEVRGHPAPKEGNVLVTMWGWIGDKFHTGVDEVPVLEAGTHVPVSQEVFEKLKYAAGTAGVDLTVAPTKE
jgi:hypothetical protein